MRAGLARNVRERNSLMHRLILALALLLLPLGSGHAGDAAKTATLYKNPQCGCCEEYADYLRDNGFTVTVKPTHELAPMSRQAGIPDNEKADPGNYLEEILLRQGEKPFHLALIGCQAHATDPELFSYLEAANFDFLRLGRAKAQVEDLEPMIRDGDLLTFNLSAISGLVAPEQPLPSPSGFSLEESCMICRYAGMSDKLKAFNIIGMNGDLSPEGLTAQSVAQLIWYFLDGVYNRKHDFPVSMDGLIEYIVDLKPLDYQLTFWRSSKSGRWWMQIPFKRGKSIQRHRLVSCSYGDYKQASQGELPDRLLHALRKYG